MQETYRNEVFKICNKLQSTEKAADISSLIRDMSISVEDKDSGFVKENLHGNFAYLAKQSNTQFHGFLLLDDNAGNLELPEFFSFDNLTDGERCLIEQGHKTLTRFIDLCTEDIKAESEIIAEAVNPYFLYKDVNCSHTARPIITDQELQSVANAFKKGNVYTTLMGSNVLPILNKENVAITRGLMSTLEKEVRKSFGDVISADLQNFNSRISDGYKKTADVIFASFILVYALKESLRMACQLFYEALCGGELPVLNNNNIIKIENQKDNFICKRYKVLIQDNLSNYISNRPGNVILMDCDPMNGQHIHEFGMISGFTMSFSQEFGNTTKYSFIALNEEMINIYNLTNYIIKMGLPKIIKRE